jgi:hypothetical protein
MHCSTINRSVSFQRGMSRRRRLVSVIVGVLSLLFGIAGVDNGAVAFAQTDEHFGSNEAWTTNAYYGTRGTYFADVDGDHSVDAIVVNDYGITVRLSDRTQFLPGHLWTSDPYYGTRGTYFADVDGEGCELAADAIVINEGGITVRRDPDFCGVLTQA